MSPHPWNLLDVFLHTGQVFSQMTGVWKPARSVTCSEAHACLLLTRVRM